jgi:rhamnosyltransferase
MVRRELEEWFASLSPDGGERVEHGTAALASGDVRRLFFTDANGCVARAAWLTVPFRAIGYAEDHQLARDMLAAGFAKVYRPNAAVIHSHDYPPVRQLRRSFDEWRGMQEVHSIAAPASPLRIALTVQRELRDDIGHARRERGGPSLGWTALRSLAHHIARALGAALGSHAGRLPAALRRALSLEGRVDLSAPVEAPR